MVGLASGGSLLFTLTELDVQPSVEGHRVVAVRAMMRNVGVAPLSYDAKQVRLLDAAGAEHSPIYGVAERPTAGLLPAGEVAELALRFHLPPDAAGVRLVYDGLAMALGEALGA
jgi:hypothetical protein